MIELLLVTCVVCMADMCILLRRSNGLKRKVLRANAALQASLDCPDRLKAGDLGDLRVMLVEWDAKAEDWRRWAIRLSADVDQLNAQIRDANGGGDDWKATA